MWKIAVSPRYICDKMFRVTLLSIFVSILTCVMAWTCTNVNEYCPDECTSDDVKRNCMKTCGLCTDSGCKNGYTRNDGNPSCVPCGEANENGTRSDRDREDCEQCPVAGKHGADCKSNCSDGCSGNQCDRWSGRCECKTGYYGTTCRKCQNCDNCTDDGSCVGGCHAGFYGRACRLQCPESCQNGTCSPDGHCLKCSHSLYGPFCGKPCPENCIDESCETNGTCSYGCKNGVYGDRCDRTCDGSCLNSSCDGVTGECQLGCRTPDGRAAPSTYGDYCNNTCSGHCERVQCGERASRVRCWAVCASGKTGAHCTEPCPKNCRRRSCHQGNGTCTSGCEPPFHGSTCSKVCSDDCKSATCVDTPAPKCTDGCVRGRTGAYCEHTCERRCFACEQVSGKCVECVDGFHGRGCQRRCPERCSVCHRHSGECLLCEYGFHGDNCNNTISTVTATKGSGFLTIVSIAVLGAVAVIALVAWLVVRRRWRPKYTLKQNGHGARDISFNNSLFQLERGSENGTELSPNPPDILRCHVKPLPVTSCDVIDISDITLADVLSSDMTECRTNSISNENIFHLHHRPCSSNIPFTNQRVNYACANQSACDTDDESDGDYADEKTCEMLLLNSSRNKRVLHDACVNEGAPPDKYLTVPHEEEVKNLPAPPKSCYPRMVRTKSDKGVWQDDVTNGSVHVQQFPTYVHNMTDRRNFSTEFQVLPDGDLHPTLEADKIENASKNRYQNIKPYDYNRVKLESNPGMQASDYINASFVHGYCVSKHYIATQGPTDCTVSDFWRMIWETNVKYVVMLTRLQEGQQPKCAMYWPDPETSIRKCGTFVVKLKQIQVRPTYILRTFYLSKKSENESTRTIIQMHYTDWMDRGPPRDGRALLSFIEYVKSLRSREDNSPLVVHCSAGVGRTGTFIALDCLTDQGMAEAEVDVFGCVSKLRHQRVKMVQTEAQYQFIHVLLLKWISSRERNAREEQGQQT